MSVTDFNCDNESNSSQVSPLMDELKQSEGASKKGKCDNEGKNSTSEQKILTYEDPGVREKNGQRLRRCYNKKYTIRALFVYLFIFLCFIGFIALLALPQKTPVCPLDVSSCPLDWLKYEERLCYYLSKAEGTWDFAQSNCSSYGASLAMIDNQQEMDFLLHQKAPTDYWIGLRWEEQHWKQPDGSLFSSWFKIRADGPCAYLDDDGASSTWCHTQRNWICRRPLHVP